MNLDFTHVQYLPKIKDIRGNLTYIEFPSSMPFDIKRVFWIYDVPGGGIRGGHAYKNQKEVIIALSGSFDVIITNKWNEQERFSLNRSYYGLYLPPLTWRHLENFSTNSVALVISDSEYDGSDYIRDLDEFKSKL
jgi:hypothetical protein